MAINKKVRLDKFAPSRGEWAIIKEVAFRGSDTGDVDTQISSPTGVRLELRMNVNTEDSSRPQSINMLLTTNEPDKLDDIDLFECADFYTKMFQKGAPLTDAGDGIFDFYIYNRYKPDADLAGNVLVEVRAGHMVRIWIEGGDVWGWTPETGVKLNVGRN